MGSIGNVIQSFNGKCVRVKREGVSNCKPPMPCARPMGRAFEVCRDKDGKIVSEKEIDYFKPYITKPTEDVLISVDKIKKPDKTEQSVFTPKNIIIGIVVVGGIFGLLKWKKII